MKRIIIAEDEPIACMDLCETLEELGCQVVGTASDGFDAIELCRQHHPDVVIMDVKMPVFDGLSAAETIMEEDIAGCIVLLTAFGDDEVIERARNAGVTAYLAKPVNPKTLLPAIELAFAQSERLRQSKEETKRAYQKIEEDRKIRKAQAVLAKSRGCTENEAYQWLRKSAMDKRISVAVLADAVLAQDKREDEVARAKKELIARRNLSEEQAYRRIAAFAKTNGLTMEKAALEIRKSMEELQ